MKKKKIKSFSVSFEIKTKILPLDKLVSSIGLKSSSGSRNRGQIQQGRKSKITWFRLFSDLPKNSKLERHIDSVIKRVERGKVFKKGCLPKDNSLSLCIAEFYDSERAYCSLVIPQKYVAWCGKHGVEIEVVAYSCS